MRTIISTLVIATGVSVLSVSLQAATLSSLSGEGSITDAEGNVKPLVENQALVKGDRVLVKVGTATISGCAEALTLKENESVKILEVDKCAAPINLATGATVAASTAAATTATAATTAVVSAAFPLAKIAVVVGGLGVVAAVGNDDAPASP